MSVMLPRFASDLYLDLLKKKIKEEINNVRN